MIQHQLNEVRQAHLEDLDNAQSKIFEGLVVDYHPNQIPEHIFSSYFLPSFMGQNPNKNWMLEWVSIAGSPNREVSVVDPSGAELFRVPAILPTQNLLLDNSKVTLNDIFTHTQTLSRSLQGGANFLFEQLGRKTQELPHAGLQNTQEAWNAILARYNIAIPQAHSATAQAKPEEDMFEY